MRGKIVMIGSMKGGVSKTVTTFNLAYSLNVQRRFGFRFSEKTFKNFSDVL